MDRPMDTAKPELIGYADRFSAAPGERLRFMVSTDLPRYEATLARLIHGDVNPAGPGFKEEVIPGVLGGTYPGRKQVAQPGSYILVPDSPLHTMVESFTLAAWIFPTTPALGRVQGILTKQDSGPAGYGLVVDARGALALRLGGEGGRQEEVSSGVPLRAGQWYFVAASYNAGDGAVRLVQRLQAPWPLPDASVVVEQTVQPVGSLHNQAPILIAAAASETTPSAGWLPVATTTARSKRPACSRARSSQRRSRRYGVAPRRATWGASSWWPPGTSPATSPRAGCAIPAATAWTAGR